MQPQILVPLDGSARAEMILPHARVWARATSSRLTLLQVIPPPAVPDPLTGTFGPGSIPYHTWETQHRQAQDYLTALARPLTIAGSPVDVAVRVGDPAPQIVAYAAGERGVIGLAMATHGWGGLDRLILGSVAEQILHTVPQPLLLVRPENRETGGYRPATGPYRTIVVPLDESPRAEAALALAQTLARASEAELVLVTVTAPAGDEERHALAGVTLAPPPLDTAASTYLAPIVYRLHAAGTFVETRLVHGTPAACILRCSAEADADLIVMATHGRGGLDRLWHGSVAQEVVRHAGRPVLLVRA